MQRIARRPCLHVSGRSCIASVGHLPGKPAPTARRTCAGAGSTSSVIPVSDGSRMSIPSATALQADPAWLRCMLSAAGDGGGCLVGDVWLPVRNPTTIGCRQKSISDLQGGSASAGQAVLPRQFRQGPTVAARDLARQRLMAGSAGLDALQAHRLSRRPGRMAPHQAVGLRQRGLRRTGRFIGHRHRARPGRAVNRLSGDGHRAACQCSSPFPPPDSRIPLVHAGSIASGDQASPGHELDLHGRPVTGTADPDRQERGREAVKPPHGIS